MKQGIVIRPDAGAHVAEIQDDLATLQALVGGYIETVPLAGDLDGVMVVNEEGRIHGMSYNRQASALAGQTIVGTAVIFGPYTDDGDFTHVQRAVLDELGLPVPA